MMEARDAALIAIQDTLAVSENLLTAEDYPLMRRDMVELQEQVLQITDSGR